MELEVRRGPVKGLTIHSRHLAKWSDSWHRAQQVHPRSKASRLRPGLGPESSHSPLTLVRSSAPLPTVTTPYFRQRRRGIRRHAHLQAVGATRPIGQAVQLFLV